MEKNKKETIAVVGAGPVGALQACILADKGYKVNLYEMRDDIRGSSKSFGRSINLALSERGRSGLRLAGLEEEVTKKGARMFGRMVHAPDGSTKFIQYGTKDKYIMSIDRRKLNEILLSEAEKRSNVTIQFLHKLRSCDVDNKTLVFENLASGEVLADESFNVVMACDGAYSALRTSLMKNSRFNFSQEFISDSYLELRIPPTSDGKYALDSGSLHIWPRGTFMLIGLPNVEDHSFVMTLFMPHPIFQSLTSEAKIIAFFKQHFNDALQLITEKSVLEAFAGLSPLRMVSIKCSPYNYKDCGVLLGDAAHAMVPFYGQGLNCGFEDLKVFDELMEKYSGDFAKVLPEFSEHRSIDAQTMNDLAMYNYKEMRDHVNSKWYLIRKKMDNLIHRLFPNSWIPLYTTVSFTRIRYHQCLKNRQWQDKIIYRTTVASALVLIGIAYLAFKHKSYLETQVQELWHAAVGRLF